MSELQQEGDGVDIEQILESRRIMNTGKPDMINEYIAGAVGILAFVLVLTTNPFIGHRTEMAALADMRYTMEMVLRSRWQTLPERVKYNREQEHWIFHNKEMKLDDRWGTD